MSIFSKIFTSLYKQKAASIPTGLSSGSYTMVGTSIVWTSDNYQSYIVNGYAANDIIYSAINLITDKIKVAPWGMYKIKDEAALKQYHAFIEQKNFFEANRIRGKALVPLETLNLKSGKLADLIKWANERETFNDLIANSCGYRLITGNSFKWANMLEAGANKGLPQEIFNMPAQHMSIRCTSSFPQRAVGYQMNLEARPFSKEEVQHIALFNPDYNQSGIGLYGQSPIKAAIKTLTRNNAAKKAGATQLDNNGAVGIAYIDDALVPTGGRKQQADAIKEVWANQYSGAENYGKVAFSGFKMGYTPVGMALKEMALTEVEAVDMRALANIWGIPSQLLNDPDNKSFNNAKEAEKALTSRCALTYLTAERNSFNQKIQNDWGFKGQNIYVDFDMSVYSELQEDQAEKWGWVEKLIVPEAYKLQMMGLDVPDELPLDLILVDSNKITLADLLAGTGGLTDAQTQAANDALNKAGLTDYLRIAK